MIGCAVVLPVTGCTSKATKSAIPSGSPAVPAPAGVAQPTVGDIVTESVTSESPGPVSDGTDGPVTTDSEIADPPTSPTSGVPAPPVTEPPSTTTTTTEPLITDGATVMVANASNQDGAASRLTARLQALGFTCQKAVTAAGVEADLATTKVYVKPGSEDVARSVSRVLGDVPIFYMPTPISIQGGPINLGAATVVVMLGADKAA